MAIDFSKIEYQKNIGAEDIPNDPFEWLMSLNGLTVLDYENVESDQWRVVVTLLHGNEPSGFLAIFQWIKEQAYKKCSTNIRFIICSVEAAQLAPVFTNRHLPGGEDQNRCFGVGRSDGYFHRANLIADLIKEKTPEAVIDMHNTSGQSPAFGVTTHEETNYFALVALFNHSTIVSHIPLGALMEQNVGCPIVTIECGGASYSCAHKVALEGLTRFTEKMDLYADFDVKNMEVIHQPIRVKLQPDITLSYADQHQNSGVTLRKDIEQMNYQLNEQGTHLGWVDQNGLDNFMIEDEHLHGEPKEYLEVAGDTLRCRQDLRIFMATRREDIAREDCLFYVVKKSA